MTRGKKCRKTAAICSPRSQADRGDYHCAICRDLLMDPVVGVCGHDFCKRCLEHWLASQASANRSCPVCRRAMQEDAFGVCSTLKRAIEQQFPDDVTRRRKELEEDKGHQLSDTRHPSGEHQRQGLAPGGMHGHGAHVGVHRGTANLEPGSQYPSPPQTPVFSTDREVPVTPTASTPLSSLFLRIRTSSAWRRQPGQSILSQTSATPSIFLTAADDDHSHHALAASASASPPPAAISGLALGLFQDPATRGAVSTEKGCSSSSSMDAFGDRYLTGFPATMGSGAAVQPCKGGDQEECILDSDRNPATCLEPGLSLPTLSAQGPPPVPMACPILSMTAKGAGLCTPPRIPDIHQCGILRTSSQDWVVSSPLWRSSSGSASASSTSYLFPEVHVQRNPAASTASTPTAGVRPAFRDEPSTPRAHAAARFVSPFSHFPGESSKRPREVPAGTAGFGRSPLMATAEMTHRLMSQATGFAPDPSSTPPSLMTPFPSTSLAASPACSSFGAASGSGHHEVDDTLLRLSDVPSSTSCDASSGMRVPLAGNPVMEERCSGPLGWQSATADRVLRSWCEHAVSTLVEARAREANVDLATATKEMELAVYMGAPSRQQYADMSTLESRVEALMPAMFPTEP